jgi:hypothetical protein
MSYEVFDNYLDEDSFKLIKSIFVNNYNFPWYYNEIITKENLDEEFNLDKHQFTHVLYRENQGVSSDFYQYIVH